MATMNGTIKRLTDKGFGFIAASDGSEYFFHQSACAGTRFDELRAYMDSFENLFLVGRNGMHKYNNQDHSMLTAMTAVDNIIAGITDKSNLWAVNTEMEYHEEKDEPTTPTQEPRKEEAVAEA